MESQIQEVARLLEEEISHYEKLVATLKKEADHLRQGSPEELVKSVKAVSEHADAISRSHRSVLKNVEAILNSTGVERLERPLRDLMLLLPPQEAQRLQRYQGTLERLQGWVRQINSRNKAFIQEALAHWKDLFSLLNPAPAVFPAYMPDGKRKPSRQLPVSLDRKV